MHQKRILLVEDDPDDCDLTLLALQKANIACAVDVVRDGAELVEYLFGTGAYHDRDASRRPDVILLDINMPKLSGLQVLQVLRRAHRQDADVVPPVVVLTSSDQEDDIHESYRLGAHGYVCKPIDFSRFIETVQQLSHLLAPGEPSAAESAWPTEALCRPIHRLPRLSTASGPCVRPEQEASLCRSDSMDRPLHLLIVEDSEADAELLLRELRKNGYRISYERVETRAAMEAALDREGWDAVIADYSMPTFDAFQAMDLAKKKKGNNLPFFIVSGTITDEMAVAGMKAGARDYLTKDNLSRLVPAVDRELRAARQQHKWEKAARQLRAAQEIQQCLFPGEDAVVPGFDVAGAVFPAEETTGDYYDFIPTPDGCLGIALGDVMGHGVGSAILMAEIRAWLRTLTVSHADVGDVLTHVNVLFVDGAPEGAFVTLLLARLDPVSRTLTHASAGHRGYIIGPSGKVRAFLDSSGLPLGVKPDSQIPSLSEIQLQPDDVVLLATDGFFEAASPDGEIFGVEGVLNVVRRHRPAPAREIVKNLYTEVQNFVHGAPQQDDMAAVVLKTLPKESLDGRFA